MALQLTLSCDEDKTENGPTLIHSTGVQDYKIPPDVVGEIEFICFLSVDFIMTIALYNKIMKIFPKGFLLP